MWMPKQGSFLDKTFTLTADFMEAVAVAPAFLAKDQIFGATVERLNYRLRYMMMEHLDGGQTALFLAKDALRKGADPNTESGRFAGQPIIVAATRYHLSKFVQILEEAGADTKEASVLAVQKGFGDISAILSKGPGPTREKDRKKGRPNWRCCSQRELPHETKKIVP
jgi:hypothetical protein